MTLSIESIRQAKERIAPYVAETPLIRLQNLDEVLGCRVYVKAECMQNTGSFKLRGAMNKALQLSPKEISRGIVAASSGNHGRAISYAAKMLDAKATIVMPKTAPKVKVAAIKALGAEVVQCETSQRFHIADEICVQRGATMVAPFNDEDIMAGQGTVGLEIVDQLPGINVVVSPISGGGLLAGVSVAIKTLVPGARLYGAEPALLPRYGESLRAGRPVVVEQNSSLADALAAQTPGDLCFPYVQENCESVVAVDEDHLKRAWKLLLLEGKLLCEPSSAIGIAAVLQGLVPVDATDRVCFIVSGGNVAFEQLSALADVDTIGELSR